MSEKIGEATVEVRASTDKLKSDLNKATRQVQSAGKRMRDKMRNAMRTVRRAMLPVTAAITAAAFALRKFSNHIDNVAKSARRLGVGVEKFQELALAAELSGAGISELETAMAQFTRKISDVENGTERTINAFKLLEKESGRAIDFSTRQKAFEDTIEALSEIGDETTRAKIALELMGARSAQRLLPFINSFQDAKQEVKDLNASISKETTEAFEEFNDSLTKLGKVGLKDVAEAMTPFVKSVTDLVERYLAWRTESDKLNESLEDSAGIFNTISKGLSAVGHGIDIAADKLAEWVSGGKPAVEELKKEVQELNKELTKEELKITGDLPKDTVPVGLEDIINTAKPDKEDTQEEIEREMGIVEETIRDSFRDAGSALREGDFSDVFSDIINNVFDRSLESFLNTTLDSILGVSKDSGGGVGGLLGSAVGSLFGSPKADGGRVMPGKYQLVGERGPEIFKADSGGTIIPNDELRGSGGQTVNVVHNNNFAGVNSVNRQELHASLQQMRVQTINEVQRLSRDGGRSGRNIRGE